MNAMSFQTSRWESKARLEVKDKQLIVAANCASSHCGVVIDASLGAECRNVLSALALAASANGPCAIQGDTAAEVLFWVCLFFALFFHIWFNGEKSRLEQTTRRRQRVSKC